MQKDRSLPTIFLAISAFTIFKLMRICRLWVDLFLLLNKNLKILKRNQQTIHIRVYVLPHLKVNKTIFCLEFWHLSKHLVQQVWILDQEHIFNSLLYKMTLDTIRKWHTIFCVCVHMYEILLIKFLNKITVIQNMHKNPLIILPTKIIFFSVCCLFRYNRKDGRPW